MSLMNRTHRIYGPALTALCALSLACGGEEPASTEAPAESAHEGHAGHAPSAIELPATPANASVSFGAPAAGEVTGPLVDGKVTVHVVMQAENLTVQPAGEVNEGAGHHHILIDPEGDGVPRGNAVPADERHIHFGGGQTETDVQLTPGAHVLMLQFADGMHRSYGPALTARVEINVVAAAEGEEAPAEGEEAPAEAAE